MTQQLSPRGRPILTPRIAPGYKDRLGTVSDSTRSMGIHLVGGKGSGKSRLMGRVIAKQDVIRRIPLVLLDPYGSTVDYLLDALLDERLREDIREDALSRLVY